MNFKKQIKRWLYNSCPGFAGSFPYFGNQVYFPKNSPSFDRVCAEGVYEASNVEILRTFAKPNSLIFDIGGHLGLMAIPILATTDSIHIVSFEPSPNSWPFLERTASNSSFKTRWEVVSKAVSDHVGVARFARCSAQDSFYDGLLSTGRGQMSESVDTEVTTVDQEWRARGEKPVSLIKIDVEGAELNVLKGAMGCLRKCRPSILTEWQPLNFQAYGHTSKGLIMLCEQEKYLIFSVPDMIPVTDVDVLSNIARLNESFLLVPRSEAN